MGSDPPRIVGLDLSLTSSGFAVIKGADVWLTRIEPGDHGGDHARIDRIRSQVWHLAEHADLVVIEGPSFGSVTGKQHERAGLWWICTRMLWRAGTPYAVVTPAQLKKYATGYGSGKNCGKDKVLAAVIRRYPMASVDGNDTADALVLAAMGADHLDCPLAGVPQIQRDVLCRITWPSLNRKPAP